MNVTARAGLFVMKKQQSKEGVIVLRMTIVPVLLVGALVLFAAVSKTNYLQSFNTLVCQVMDNCIHTLPESVLQKKITAEEVQIDTKISEPDFSSHTHTEGQVAGLATSQQQQVTDVTGIDQTSTDHASEEEIVPYFAISQKSETASSIDASRVLEISNRSDERLHDDLIDQINNVAYSGTLEDSTFSGSTTLSSLLSNALLFTNSTGVLSASAQLSVRDNSLGLGTTTPVELLTIEGAAYFASTTPANTSNRLYNSGGDLYWNGTVLSAASTTVWSLLSGNAYRLTGNVGIGTSTPTSLLTVAGDISASTTTAVIYDTGGAVCNVKAYGAIGDDATDDYAAIMAAIADCPEDGIVLFPSGIYRISQTIVLDRPATLQGTYAPRWSYSATPRSVIKATIPATSTPFTGTSIIHVRDRTISGETEHNNGGRFVNISLDGNSFGITDGNSTGASNDVDGIYFEGLVRDWRLVDVDISQVSANGFHAAVGGGSGNPRGFTIRGLSIYSANGHGFRATALNDSYIEDVLAVANALRGFYISDMGETKFLGSRAAFNALEGLYIDGSSNNGGLQFTDFSTDRNDRHGVRISQTGTTTVSFNGLLTRRDGANSGGGDEAPYAGLAVIGTSTGEKAAPVVVSNLTQIVGINDGGGGEAAPGVGVRVVNAKYVKVGGVLSGTSTAYQDDGGNDTFVIEEDSVMRVGYVTPSETIYNNKWIATSTGLYYLGGKINIGTTTGARLMNIEDANSPGFRMTDTTNNLRFDIRAEDYQAFFGTFSNHDLRFQTNNTSRLTIDTTGEVGIGTTSPWRTLTVVGTAAFSGLSAATSSGSALCLNGTDEVIVNSGAQTCTVSSARFKNSITDLDNSELLDLVSQLRPVSFVYNGTEGARIGLIAEEVSLVEDRLVFTEIDGTPRGVRYEDLSVVLLGALQAQQERIELLAASVREATQNIFDTIFADHIVVENIDAQRIDVTEEICIAHVCVTAEQLEQLLENADVPSASPAVGQQSTSSTTESNEEATTTEQTNIEEETESEPEVAEENTGSAQEETE